LYSSCRPGERHSVSEAGAPARRKAFSQLSSRDGRTAFTSIGSSQLLAQATVPRSVPKPISAASRPKCPRASSPMLNSPCQPIIVADASPIWLLCAQTTAFALSPRCSITRFRVSNMCRSRRFQLSTYMTR
jgi:hypothetical protein